MPDPLVNKPSAAELILKAALIEGPLLLGGIFLYLRTNNLLWIFGAMALGACFMLPAILRAAKTEEHDDASG